MSATAPVIEVRNMNRMTWLSAPTAKPFGFAVTSPTSCTRHRHAARPLRPAPGPRASASSNATPFALAADRAAETSAAWSAIAASMAVLTALA